MSDNKRTGFKGIPLTSWVGTAPVNLSVEKATYSGVLMGIRLENGTILAFPKPNTHYGAAKELAKTMGGEVVTVRGTWSFEVEIAEVTDDD